MNVCRETERPLNIPALQMSVVETGQQIGSTFDVTNCVVNCLKSNYSKQSEIFQICRYSLEHTSNQN